jgi:hypothetical protein
MVKIAINRSARLLIEQYGADAAVRAARNADALLERGNLGGYYTWMQIGRRIERMQEAEGRVRH